MENKNAYDIGELTIKIDKLVFILDRLVSAEAKSEEEEISRDEAIATITYWIGAARLHVDQEDVASVLNVSLDEVMGAIDDILNIFVNATTPYKKTQK